MKKTLLHIIGIALSLCLTINEHSAAQIVNGDFETQYPNTPPSVEDNIQPNNSGVDQLPNWSVPLQITSTSYGAIGTFAGFEATNAALATGMNPAQPLYYATFPSSPHNNSTGRVGIKRPSTFDFQNDGLIMQQVTLTPGHLYQVSFWALKTSTGQYKSKMAFSVVNSSSAPLFDSKPSTNSIVPAPYNIITSNYITDMSNWTQVTGTFVASTLPSGSNTWVVVGFDRSLPVFDAAVGSPGVGSTNMNYAIDDVTVTDLTCANDPPVAGANQTICPNTSAVIGQGCFPVGATLQWRVQGSSTVFATSLQTSVTPTSTTTYELTVTQANGTVSTSQTTVTVFDPNNFVPQLAILVADDCYGLYLYSITNYNPAYTYTVQVINGYSSATTVNPGMRGGAGTFELARAKKAPSGSFTVAVNYAGCGGHTATSALTTRSFPTFPACRLAAAQNTDNEEAVAYPNPATETLTMPEGVASATLLNSTGKPVQSADKLGKLDVHALPEGLYNLQMMQKGKLVNQRIQVKH